MNNNDCETGNCFDNVCVSCNDGVKSGNETAIDCGGDCKPCTATGVAATGSCKRDADCKSGRCVSDMCVSCFNSIKDGDEAGAANTGDCGGSCDKKCAIGGLCGDGEDCITSYCDTTCKTPPASVHCSNGAENADLGETDTGKSHNKCLQFLCKRRTNTLSSTFLLQIVADRDVLPTVLPVQWAKNVWKVVTAPVVCVRTNLLPLLLQQIEL